MIPYVSLTADQTAEHSRGVDARKLLREAHDILAGIASARLARGEPTDKLDKAVAKTLEVCDHVSDATYWDYKESE